MEDSCTCHLFIYFLLYVNRNYDRPQLVEAFKGKFVQEISCGSSHSAAVLSSGELFTWGLGEYGRLGHGDNQMQVRPKQASINPVSYTHLTLPTKLEV